MFRFSFLPVVGQRGLGQLSRAVSVWLNGAIRTAVAATAVSWPAVTVHAAIRPALEIAPPDAQGWVRFSLPGETGMVYTVQASTNLSEWSPMATAHDNLVAYPDLAAPLFPNRFYRVAGTNRTEGDDWKNQVHLPQDSFIAQAGTVMGPDIRWIKFAIPLRDPSRVYYQDSRKYEFHYDFATRRLEGFSGLTPSQFDQVALRTNQQQVLLGAILVPPPPNDAEYGIQFVGQDPYPAEFLARYFEAVKATVAAGPNVSAFYVPAFEQAYSVQTNRAFFESRGIRLTSVDRWVTGNDVYSTGWAVGNLKYFPGTEIAAAFRDGRLLPQDILLTDAVPAEVPVLAGVLTLSPSTPNSHVAILSKTFGLPFAYISDADQQAWVQQLVGRDILLRLNPYSLDVKVVGLETTLDPALREEIIQLKLPPKLHIVAKAKYGRISASTDALTPADIQYFGGKASNFGFLRRQIPEHSPAAIALSFDLWDEFLNQILPSGRTLRAEIDGRLSGYSYPPNVAALENDLAEIRSLITRTASFSAEQKQAILEALQHQGFASTRKIRFRSSTNVEDSEQFTGAGLYDSFSGCLADDTDQDTTGPSQCDPTEPDERGVFRAIQKVYASFYNDNAVIERLRHHLDENTVGMAVLVHYSAPDEMEMANGVATLQAQWGSEFNNINGDLVTQKGAVSVTNPDGSAKPEVVAGYLHSFGAGGFLKQRSSLVPLGAYVMDWDTNYVSLMKLFASVADGYYRYFSNKTSFTLDFEYKKLAPGVLEVKQVREVPVTVTTNMLPAYLVHETNQFAVFQGEGGGDVFSNHRLKSFWAFHTRNLKLAQSNLQASLFTQVEADYLDGQKISHLSGSPVTLPNASHAVENDAVMDRWTAGSGPDQRQFELRTTIRQDVSAADSPVFTLPDFRIELTVSYATPQPALQMEFDGLKQVLITNHWVTLQPPRVLVNTNFLQERSVSGQGVTVRTSYYWPDRPGGAIIEKTSPLARWNETRIEGLTSEPIVLRGEFSQTYRPGHHNFSEEFIFEPSLESGISPTILQELKAANVQLIYMLINFDHKELAILGTDGKFRTLSSIDSGKGG